jgi:membrane protein DedA with SNARE-associated domain
MSSGGGGDPDGVRPLLDFVAAHGVYAVFVLMALDALLPIGGEAVMLYAGALPTGAVGGHAPMLFGMTLHADVRGYVVLALAGTLGYLVGSWVGWGIGRRGGHALLERHGRWLHLGPERLARAEAWFARRGSAAVLLGRLTPLVRSFISVTAGVLGSPLGVYSALTLLGSAVWCFGFAGAGWALGDNYGQVDTVMHGVELAGAVALVLAVVAVVVRRRRARALARTG